MYSFHFISLSSTDPEQWRPAYLSANMTSAPVAFVLESRFPNGTTTSSFYAVNKFRMGCCALPSEVWNVSWSQKKQTKKFIFCNNHFIMTLKTPNGVYCEGRAKGKPLPNIPKAFSFRAQAVSTSPIPTITNIKVHIYYLYIYSF
jgi:hypothetical protein